MGIVIPKKDIVQLQQKIVDDTCKDLNYFQIAAVSSQYLDFSSGLSKKH